MARKQRVRTWFFRIRQNQLFIVYGDESSAPYIQPENGPENYLITPKDSQQLDDASLMNHIIESFDFMLRRLS